MRTVPNVMDITRWNNHSKREVGARCVCGWSIAYSTVSCGIEAYDLRDRHAKDHRFAHEKGDGYFHGMLGWTAYEKVQA